jgi:hypothetical protein
VCRVWARWPSLGEITSYVTYAGCRYGCCEELTTALQLSSKFNVTGQLRVRDEARGEDEEGKEDEDDKLSHEGGV